MSYEELQTSRPPLRADPPRLDEMLTGAGDDPTLTEKLVGCFRAALRELGVGHWRIYCPGPKGDLSKCLDGPAALDWEGAERHELPLTVDGEQPIGLDGARVGQQKELGVAHPGVVLLREQGVAHVRWWQWMRVEECWQPVTLLAAPDLAHLRAFRETARRRKRDQQENRWQIVLGDFDDRSVQRTQRPDDEVMLPASVRRRYEREMVGFFSEPVREMYAQLGLAYRRGVLLHGPPGNGKTSLIRQLGAALPDVAALLLRACHDLDEGGLRYAVERWIEQAPAMLVVEDLDTLFTSSRVSLSSFLNLMDGVCEEADGGLLLVATTNHPGALDPALNNRPGRFDVVMELPAPDAELRRRFFDHRLPETSAALREQLVERTVKLSFAHLEEVMRLSGLAALYDGRTARRDADLIEACAQVHRGWEEAVSGFPGRTGSLGFHAGSN